MQVSLKQVLDAREERVCRRNQLLQQYRVPLLCFTMNIPGPNKLDRDISIGFAVGNWLLQDALQGCIVHKELYRHCTGCEAYYAVNMDEEKLKQIAIGLEETDPIGRLFDMDVFSADGKKISREALKLPGRKCLLCDNDAFLCARSRSHSLEQLQNRTGFLLYLAARQWMTEYIAVRAYLALQQEVATTPKPGLVDRCNRGAHKDMGLGHFFASANALRPFFFRFAETGFLTREQPAGEVFPQLRAIGQEAESAMLRATGGVNTHKGAIFSLGLLCAAAGRLDPAQWLPDTLLSQCAEFTQGLVSRDLGALTEATAKTPGEQFYVNHNITGVRGQAEAGYPAVKQTGLPLLLKGLSQGLSLNDAGAAVLLHLLAATDDTNLIHRSDRQTQLQVKAQIAQLLQKDPFPSMAVIEQLDREFTEKNLSPGGSADLLAMTYFLLFLTQDSASAHNN